MLGQPGQPRTTRVCVAQYQYHQDIVLNSILVKLSHCGCAYGFYTFTISYRAIFDNKFNN